MNNKAFTLAELLIALAILGVIATFTIPKVLVSQQDQKNNAIAKEAASAVSVALDSYRQSNTVTSGTGVSDLTPYFNYVRITTGQIDQIPGSGMRDCSLNSDICFVLHNGAVINFPSNNTFSGTADTNAINFYVDPDGQYGGSTTGSSKSVMFFLYPNGRLTSRSSILPNTTTSAQVYASPCACDPSWFTW